MHIWQSTTPEFDPYGDQDPDRGTRSPDGGPAPWQAPRAQNPVNARMSVPGSKSLTNRELVLSALADEPSRLRAPWFPGTAN